MTTDTITTAPPADATTAPWWVWIERDYEDDQDARDVAIGPFPTEEAAALAGQESALVDYLLSPSGGGGTDCYWNQVQPTEEHEQQIIDPNNRDHTGAPLPTVADALALAVLALNTLAHPDATDRAGFDALDAGTPAAVEVLADLADRLSRLPQHDAHTEEEEHSLVVVFDGYGSRTEAAHRLAAVLDSTTGLGDVIKTHTGIESWWFAEADLKHVDGNDRDAMTLVEDERTDAPAPVPAPVG